MTNGREVPRGSISTLRGKTCTNAAHALAMVGAVALATATIGGAHAAGTVKVGVLTRSPATSPHRARKASPA